MVRNKKSYKYSNIKNKRRSKINGGKPILKINVTPFNEKSFTLDGVDSENTIDEVKTIIEGVKRIPAKQQELFFGTYKLEDDKTLAYYEIESGSSFELLPSYFDEMPIYVDSINLNQRFKLYVNSTDTIRSVKAKIRNIWTMHNSLPKFLPMPQNVAAEVGIRLDWNDELIRRFAKSAINGRKIMELNEKELREFVEQRYADPDFKTFPKGETERALNVIERLKAERINEPNISDFRQRLLFNSTELDDGRTLADYNIQRESRLGLLLRPAGVFQIFVNTQTDNIIELEVESPDTIGTVKAKIQDKEGIPAENQRLFFNMIQLPDEETLAHYNIRHNSQLQLIYDPPRNLCDIISGKLLKDPVIASDGHTYSRKWIIWFIKTYHRSPTTGEPISDATLIPNIRLRRLADQIRENRNFLDDTGGNVPEEQYVQKQEPPDELCDMVFDNELFNDPVIASDGITYSRSKIVEWLADHDTSPSTGGIMPNRTLIPNDAVRVLVEQWKKANQIISEGGFNNRNKNKKRSQKKHSIKKRQNRKVYSL
jgi:ubiquitin C